MIDFDDFLDKAKDFSRTAGRKTEECIEVSKLQIKASKIKCEIRKKCEQLGINVYKTVRSQNGETDYILNYVDEIHALKCELKIVNERINTFLGKNTCPNCGKINKKNVRFCSYCGTEFFDDDELGV